MAGFTGKCRVSGVTVGLLEYSCAREGKWPWRVKARYSGPVILSVRASIDRRSAPTAEGRS